MSSPSVKPQSSIVYQPSPLSENASSKRYSFNPALNPRPLSILENSTMKNSPRMRAITLGSRPAPNISAILSAANKKPNVTARRHISPIPQIEEGNQVQQTPTPPQSPQTLPQTQPQNTNNSFMHRTTSRTTRAPPPLQPSTTTRPNLSPLNRASLGPASTSQVQVPRPINMINRLGPIRRPTSDSLSNISPPTSPTRTNSMFSAFSRNISPSRNSISRRPIAEPQEIAVANRCLTKLLVSSQIPPPPRRIRSLTPKMMATSIPKRPVKSQAPTGTCYINELPSDILEIIFTDLTVDEILDCSLVCSTWVKPSRAAYASVKKIFPFAGSSMLKALRATLDKIEISSNRISDLRDDIQELAEEYCQSNPETYTAFNPLDPVDLMFNLFWFFLIVDHELRSPTTRGRITSSHFIRTIREAYPKQLVDKAALKAIYEDIKKKPLISRSIPEEPQTIELPTIQPTATVSSTSSSTTRSSPNNLSEPIRKWWRKIRRQSTEAHSDSRINYDPNIPFRNLDDTTQHRPPPRIAL